MKSSGIAVGLFLAEHKNEQNKNNLRKFIPPQFYPEPAYITMVGYSGVILPHYLLHKKIFLLLSFYMLTHSQSKNVRPILLSILLIGGKHY